MAEGADLELYIQSFENDLAQAGICREKWKSYFTSRLPPFLNDHIGDLQADHTTTYDQIKDRLLTRVGQTSLQAGQQLF